MGADVAYTAEAKMTTMPPQKADASPRDIQIQRQIQRRHNFIR